MKVKLSKYRHHSDGNFDVLDRVRCELNGAEVEVRHDEKGGLIVVIKDDRDNRVTMEARAAAIWLEVKGAEGDA